MEPPSFQWGPNVPNAQPDDSWMETFFDFDGCTLGPEHYLAEHSDPTAQSTTSSPPPPPEKILYPVPNLRVGEQAPTTMDPKDMHIDNSFLYEDSFSDDPVRFYHDRHAQNSPIGQPVPEADGIARAPTSHPAGAVSHVLDAKGHGNKCFRCLARGIQCMEDPEHKPACKRCSKDYPGWPQACIRRGLTTIATKSARDRFASLGNYLSPAEPEDLISCSIELSFSSEKAHKPLKLTLQEYVSGTEKTVIIERYGLLPKDMVEWSEQMIDDNDPDSFEVAIEDFVKCYSQPVRTAMQEPIEELERPLTELLDKVHSLKAMCRIILCDEYTIVKSNGVPTSQPLAPGPKAELRSIACSTLKTIESDVLAELDRYLGSKIDADQGKLKTGQESRPALWATFWQLIFVYDHLLGCSHNADLEFLLKTVSLFYSSVFYIKGNLRMTPQDFYSTGQTGVSRAFKHVMSLRKSYFHRVKDDDKDIYHLIPYSVDQELKLLKLTTHSAPE
ncbi:hypothetical protein CPLU01_11928 [Colletotrichum plurivorum]|uniref:Uncharacterized protein n=1 Tax=Colletotrichum plurivorum TaxID=2175906 RepID=A0A8H6N7I6_9PEZI|nr:hypothetical protein CPLU01_11928 [Colletotrichum plurivorum]